MDTTTPTAPRPTFPVCPNCGRTLPGPASLRMHIAAAHSPAAIAKQRENVRRWGTRNGRGMS